MQQTKNYRLKAQKRGFTLIELLVVIAILGVLLIAGGASYLQSLRRGRDARRRADLKAIVSAQEQYYAVNGSYASIGSTGGATCAGSMPGYLDTIPVDPKNLNGYSCMQDTAASPTAYCIYTVLEIAGSGNCNRCTSCTSTGCTLDTSSLNSFCMMHAQ